VEISSSGKVKVSKIETFFNIDIFVISFLGSLPHHDEAMWGCAEGQFPTGEAWLLSRSALLLE
jgi:hypothetical protein